MKNREQWGQFFLLHVKSKIKSSRGGKKNQRSISKLLVYQIYQVFSLRNDLTPLLMSSKSIRAGPKNLEQKQVERRRCLVQKKFCISLSFPLQNADFEQVLVPLQKLVEYTLLSFDKISSGDNLKTIHNGFVSSLLKQRQFFKIIFFAISVHKISSQM